MSQVNNRSALHDSQLLAVLDSIVVDLGVLQTPGSAIVTDASNIAVTADALVVDASAIRTSNNDNVSDVVLAVSEINVIVTKLNSDAGVSDTDYVSVTTPAGAVAGALTSASVSSLTAVAPASPTTTSD